jgi:hypothetical protein
MNSPEITHSIRLGTYFETEGVVANFNNSKKWEASINIIPRKGANDTYHKKGQGAT